MTRIPRVIIEHLLNINHSFPPIKQKKRTITREQNDVVNQEVAELVHVGVVQANQFLVWIANLALVTKSDGSM